MDVDKDLWAQLGRAAEARLGDWFGVEATDEPSGDSATLVARDNELFVQPGLVVKSRSNCPQQTNPPSLQALAALLTSRVLQMALGPGTPSAERLRALPLPEIDRIFEMQLELLWRRYEAAPQEREALAGAFDRIAAELYAFTVDDLMNFEQRRR